MQRTDLTDKTAALLIQHLVGHDSLEKLSIADNDLGRDTAELLAGMSCRASPWQRTKCPRKLVHAA
jgi:hypothetical protein